MAKGRMLNKKISNSKRVNDLPAEAALLYTWLISHLDYNGVFYGSAQMVKSLVFPRRNCSVKQVENWLRAMETAKNDDGMTLIIRFRVNGDLFLWMPGFKGEQPGLRSEREATDFPQPPQIDKTRLNVTENSNILPELLQQNAGVTPENCGKNPAEVESNYNYKVTIKEKEVEGDKGVVTAATLPEDFEDYKNSLRVRFKDLDFNTELEKFSLYWSESGRKIKRPKSALLNWMTKAREIRQKNEGANNTAPAKHKTGITMVED